VGLPDLQHSTVDPCPLEGPSKAGGSLRRNSSSKTPVRDRKRTAEEKLNCDRRDRPLIG
jgi:hypothetical protein